MKTGSVPRVLLVEDHVIIKQALAVALAASGMQVEMPAELTVEAVVAHAQRFGPDVVLLDYWLGEIDSLPMIEPLKALGAQVIVLTGTQDPRALGDCIEAGAVAIVEKSESLERLVRAVEDAVAGHTVMRPAQRDALVEAAHRLRGEDEAKRAPFDRLTPRERLVLGHLMHGRSAEEIARLEFVSLATVRSQIRSVLQKLDVNSRLAAVTVAQQVGWAP
jgi:two-component system nitrate/nitrite response regulator NarL